MLVPRFCCAATRSVAWGRFARPFQSSNFFHTHSYVMKEAVEEREDKVEQKEEELRTPEDSAETIKEETEASQLDELETQLKVFKDQLLRQVAETENVRKMGAAQVEDAKKFGVQALVKDLLSVVDTLELTLEKVSVKEGADKELEQFHSAVLMMEKDLHKALGSHGVERFHPLGDDFDPSIHEALFQAPHEEAPKNTVMQVVKPGYFLNKRVLRPAAVGVSAGPPAASKDE